MSGGKPKRPTRRRGSDRQRTDPDRAPRGSGERTDPDRAPRGGGERTDPDRARQGDAEPDRPVRRFLASLHRGWWFLVGTAVAALLGAVASLYVPKLLDPPNPRAIAVNVVPNPATVDTWGTAEFGMVLPPDAHPSEQPPVGCADLIDWARGNGAVDHRVSRVRLIVQGVTEQGVLIDNLRARVIRRSSTPEPAGVQLRCGGTQGTAEPRDIEMDLDAPKPTARYRELIEGRRPLFGFTLAKGETEVFDLTATTTGTVEWTIELDLVVDGKRRTVEVTNRGGSFVTTAGEGPRGYRVPPGEFHWVECAPAPRLACPDTGPPTQVRFPA